MQLKSLTPMLRKWDLRASITFYTEVLGFECESLSEEWGWASLRRDGVSIMLAGPNEHEGDKAPAFTGLLYFPHRRRGRPLATAERQDARMLSDRDFEYGMREFAIYDNNGYMLQFGHHCQPRPNQRFFEGRRD